MIYFHIKNVITPLSNLLVMQTGLGFCLLTYTPVFICQIKIQSFKSNTKITEKKTSLI